MSADLAARGARVRDRMAACGVDVLLCSVGADLPWLTGYEAVPLERLTMLVLPRDGPATLVVPALEAPRVVERPDVFALRPWAETEDPVAIVGGLVGDGPRRVAVGARTWAVFLLALQERLPAAGFLDATALLGPLRACKDDAEIAALAAAAAAADGVARALRSVSFAGRTERDVQRELCERILDAGHEEVSFAIVASGPNAASPHHDPGDRRVGVGDVVLCDFGGRRRGYCSDITRVFAVGEPAAEVRDAWSVLQVAQEEAVRTARAGVPAEDVDAAARRVLTDAGFGEAFWHRTGHGIGLEPHEPPYLVAGNREPLRVGHTFSVEPGLYLPGRFGLRLEDIVVVTGEGPRRLNHAPRDLPVVG